MEICPQHERMEQVALKHTEFVGRTSQQIEDMCELIRKNDKILCEVRQDINELKIIAKLNKIDIDKIAKQSNSNGSTPKVLNEVKKEDQVRKFSDSINKAWINIQDNAALLLLVVLLWIVLKIALFKESVKILGWVIG